MEERYKKLLNDVTKYLLYYSDKAQASYDDDAFWNEVLSSANGLVKRNGNSRLAEQLMLAVLDEVERDGHGRPLETKEQVNKWNEAHKIA